MRGCGVERGRPSLAQRESASDHASCAVGTERVSLRRARFAPSCPSCRRAVPTGPCHQQASTQVILQAPPHTLARGNGGDARARSLLAAVILGRAGAQLRSDAHEPPPRNRVSALVPLAPAKSPAGRGRAPPQTAARTTPIWDMRRVAPESGYEWLPVGQPVRGTVCVPLCRPVFSTVGSRPAREIVFGHVSNVGCWSGFPARIGCSWRRHVCGGRRGNRGARSRLDCTRATKSGTVSRTAKVGSTVVFATLVAPTAARRHRCAEAEKE